METEKVRCDLCKDVFCKEDYELHRPQCEKTWETTHKKPLHRCRNVEQHVFTNQDALQFHKYACDDLDPTERDPFSTLLRVRDPFEGIPFMPMKMSTTQRFDIPEGSQDDEA